MEIAWIPFIIYAGNLKKPNILKNIWKLMKKEIRDITYCQKFCLIESARKLKVSEILKDLES